MDSIVILQEANKGKSFPGLVGFNYLYTPHLNKELILKKSIFLFLSVFTIILVSCAPLANAMGYVPQADLDAANKQVSDLNSKLTTANAEIEKLKTGDIQKDQQISSLQGEFDKAQKELKTVSNQLGQSQSTLEDWRSIQCEQSWEDVWYNAMFNFPLTDYSGIPEYFHFYLAVTQWSTDPEWKFDDSKDFSVIVFDRDDLPSMAIDTVNDCIIFNPDVFRFLEQ